MSPFARVANWFGGLLPERWSRRGAEDADASSGPGEGQSRPRGEWQELAPLRTPRHRRPVEVSRVTGFAQGLQAQHRSPGSLAPLGHQVTKAAPQGVATGIARAVTTTVERAAASSGAGTTSSAVDMPLRRPRAEPPHRGPSQSPVSTPATPETPPAPTGGPPAGAPEPASTSSEPAHAPSDQTSAATDPGQRPPSRPTLAGRPPIRVLRATDDEAATAAVARTRAAMPRDLPLRRLGSPSEASAAATSPGARPGGDHEDAPAVAGDAADERRDQQDAGATSERPTVGSSSIVVGADAPPDAIRPDAETARGADGRQEPTGIGEPLRSLPPSARPAGSGQARVGRSVTGRGRREAVSRGLQRWATSPEPAEEAASPGGSGPGSGEAATTSGRPRRRQPAGPPVVAASLPAVHRTVEDPPGPVAPTVGSTPLVERDDPPGPRREPDRDQGPVEAAPVPVRWRDVAPVTGTDTPAPAGSAPGTSGGPAERGGSPRGSPAVMRAARATPTTAGPTPAGPTPGGAGPASPLRSGARTSDDQHRGGDTAGPRGPVQRSNGARASDGRSGEGSRLPLPQLPRILRRLNGSSDQPASAASSDDPAPTPPTPPTNGEAPASAGPPNLPPVHRQAEAPAGDAPAAGGAGDDPAAEEPAGDAETSEGADALFRKLYPRVRDELRWELRVQRERAGMLSDPL